VLALHGPSILDAFGSYAFLDERLVPLDIVLSGIGDGDTSGVQTADTGS
jgi:hypothetical protein